MPWVEFAGLEKVWGIKIGDGVANCGDESRPDVTFEVDSNPGVIFWVDSNPGVMFGVDSNLDVMLGVMICGIVRAEAETAIMLSKANIILYIDIPPTVNPWIETIMYLVKDGVHLHAADRHHPVIACIPEWVFLSRYIFSQSLQGGNKTRGFSRVPHFFGANRHATIRQLGASRTS